MKIGQKITHLAPTIGDPPFVNGKLNHIIDRREVKLMAVSGSYAMIRRPRGMPYVAPIKELVK